MKLPTLKTFVGVGLLVLLLNSGYIAAFAHPTIFYMTSVLGHLVLGVVLSIAFAVLLVRDRSLARILAPSALLFAIAFGFAAWLTWYGNIRQHSWALEAHIVAAVLGVVALLPYVVGLSRSSGPGRTFAFATQVIAIMSLALPIVVTS